MRVPIHSTHRRGRRRIVGALSAALLCTAGVTALPAAARTPEVPRPDGASRAARTADPAPRLPDGLAATPPMGFNNWNSTHCRAEFNEEMVKGIADLFVAKGLKDAGYQYVNLDDCWALPTRDGNGKLVPDPQRFPHGIKAVADYVHAKGLKFGIYTSVSIKTCNPAGFPGGLGHEQSDARQFADWGVDYLKYDNCNNLGVDAEQRYRAMRDALKATGRPHRLQRLRMGREQALGVGVGRRTPVAHHRRHQRLVVEHAPDRQAEPAAGAVHAAPGTGTTRTCWRSATAG